MQIQKIQGLVFQVRKELGISLSKATISEKESQIPLQEAILKFYHRYANNIITIWTYTKQMVTHPKNKSEMVSVHYWKHDLHCYH